MCLPSWTGRRELPFFECLGWKPSSDPFDFTSCVCVFVWGLVESQSSQPHSVYSLNESNQRAREFEYSHHRLPFDDDVGLFLPSFLRHW